MNLEFSQKLIHYPLTDDLQLSEMNFWVLSTASVGEVVWQKKRAGSSSNQSDRPDTWVFLDSMLEIFKFGDQPNQITFEHVTLIYQLIRRPIECFGFIYFSNLTILPIRFEQSENFQAWIQSLAAGMSEAPTIVFTIRPNGMSTSRWKTPDWQSQTTACLQANLPKLYKKPQLQAEKQDFLNASQPQASMRQTIDITETERLWRSFMKMTPSLQEHNKNSLGEKQTAKFEAFATETGYELPPELKTIYQLSDGATADFMGPKLMPLSQVIQEWKNWKQIFDEWTLEELTGNNEADGEKTLGIYTNPYWIPLISDAAGNFIGMDLMPGKAGKTGQIIRFGTDIDTITVEAEDLNQFLFFAWDYYEAVHTAQQNK